MKQTYQFIGDDNKPYGEFVVIGSDISTVGGGILKKKRVLSTDPLKQNWRLIIVLKGTLSKQSAVI